MHNLLPQVSAALFSDEDAARDHIRQAMREDPRWREGLLYQRLRNGQFVAEVSADPALVALDETHGCALIARHDRAGWLGAEETADA